MITIKGKYTTAKIMIDQIDDSCAEQISTMVNHEAFTNSIRIMPDTHTGKGSVIGFTMKLTDKVIPNIIGVDIGCGMCSAQLGKQLNVSFKDLDAKIRKKIPFGFNIHDTACINLKNDFPWHEVQNAVEKFFYTYKKEFNIHIDPPRCNQDWFLNKSKKIGGNTRRFINAIGTLGGGNHFIETGVDDHEHIWITVHTGSRNFGKRICEYWQGMAAKQAEKKIKSEMKRCRDSIRDQNDFHGMKKDKTKLKDISVITSRGIRGLEYLEGNQMIEYLYDMIFAQIYAQVNRKFILNALVSIMKISPSKIIETIHNYIDFEDLIIRKGAIAAYSGQALIIPFNMRDGIIICEGLSNKEWNFSAPHGAGRIMSRSMAKKTLHLEIFREQMKDIYSTSIGYSTLDESPDTYKRASLIEQTIAPTAQKINKIIPLHNMKDISGTD